MSYTAGQVGDPQVRHRGTIGGSLAHGDPASDLPAVMLALDARARRARHGRRARRSRRADFFTGVFETALAPGRDARRDPRAEARRVGRLVVPQDEPPRPGLGDRRRRGGRAPRQRLDRAARRSRSRTWARTPLRAKAAEEALAGGAVGRGRRGARHRRTRSRRRDHAASAEFRRHLARVLARRALEQALRGLDASRTVGGGVDPVPYGSDSDRASRARIWSDLLEPVRARRRRRPRRMRRWRRT